jgi:hypothetical protein
MPNRTGLASPQVSGAAEYRAPTPCTTKEKVTQSHSTVTFNGSSTGAETSQITLFDVAKLHN